VMASEVALEPHLAMTCDHVAGFVGSLTLG
jgi:hypothetical protein